MTVSSIQVVAISCAAVVKWKIISNVCGICSTVIPSLEIPGASVLDEFYWLNKHDTELFTLSRANGESGNRCPYRWANLISSHGKWLHGNHEVVVHDEDG